MTTATVATMLAAIVARDFGDDLVRAFTFPGGYRPTARVLLQRHWGAELGRIAGIALEHGFTAAPECSVNSLWMDRGCASGSAYIGVRDNRDRAAYDAAMRRLGAALKASGFKVRHRYEGGMVVSTKVTTDPRGDALVMEAAPTYLERLERAIAAAA